MTAMKTLTKVIHLISFILLIVFFLYERTYYLNSAKNTFTLENYFEDPQTYGEQKDERFGKIINISQDHFYFNLGDKIIKVYGSGIKRSLYGETVVFLHYRKDGKIELINYHNYNYNYLLYIISFLALIIFAIIFLREWKITKRGFIDA